MNKANIITPAFGIVGLLSILLTSIGYVIGHKYFSIPQFIGALKCLWQVLTAILVISAAAGIGERVLKFSDVKGPIRFGIAAALGLFIISIGVLIWGSTVGTNPVSFVLPILIILVVFHKDILIGLRNLDQMQTIATDKYEKFIAIGVVLIFGGNLMIALAPPVQWDSLVYHFALPSKYLSLGHITYLPDTVFWGMPQFTEMLYLLLIGFAGIEAASVFGVLIGALTVIGILGYVNLRFNSFVAWVAVAALFAGGTLAGTLSSGYVDWMSMLFGWASLVALQEWLEKRDWRMLILAGVFCGGALGTKYTAGVLLVGAFATLLFLRKQQTWRTVFFHVVILGCVATLTSSPWWIKNFIATGSPFYPFFIPAGAMDQLRLTLIHNTPPWGDWRTVILLPWQATFLGFDAQEGFAATVGPLLVGLTPPVVINWQLREESQKRTILIAFIVAIIGSILWAVASRISGLLIQTRLYFVIFPALAILAGAGMDAIWNVKSMGIRFGRLVGLLALFMFGLSVFSNLTGVISVNPFLYIFRIEDQHSYLVRRLGTHILAMEKLRNLPENSHVLMLWEPKGYYCQPVCDSDELLDRWSYDSNKIMNDQSMINLWREEGYTHLLIWNQGRQFVQAENRPDALIDWNLLDSTLGQLRVEEQIADGDYTLYKIP
jgi:hypothetical protein